LTRPPPNPTWIWKRSIKEITMSPLTTDKNSFKTDVLDSAEPVVVDFWAEWCGPCKMIAPAREEISEELGDKVTIAKMDIMENTGVPGEIGVQSIPLMVLFKDGKPVAQKLGAAPKSQLKGWLESEL
jgi:thioredoxin 1